MCKDCLKKCVCANCVYNKNYAINTPKPCLFADCDICKNCDMASMFCNQHLTIAEVNAKLSRVNA